jgi:hypothetical protein
MSSCAWFPLLWCLFTAVITSYRLPSPSRSARTVASFSVTPAVAKRITTRSQLILHAASNDEALPPGAQLNPDLKEFLDGNKGKVWKGTRDILRRRQQVPLPEYSPAEVCRTILAALQDNDLPQLDNGAAVVLEFKSPTGLLAEGNLDPAAYGRFLRGTDEYSSLIDFKSAELVGETQKVGGDSLSVRQVSMLKVVEGG